VMEPKQDPVSIPDSTDTQVEKVADKQANEVEEIKENPDSIPDSKDTQADKAVDAQADEVVEIKTFVNLNSFISKDSWKSLGVSDELIENLLLYNFTSPANIQAEVLKLLTARPTCVACIQSKNGSGKTLCYLIPTLERIDGKNANLPTIENKGRRQLITYSPQAVIVVHSRELANQVHKVLTRLITNDKKVLKNIQVCLIKAENYDSLQTGGQILITTPGVLKNLLGLRATIQVKQPKGGTEEMNANISLKNTKIVCIDEADEVYSIDLNAAALDTLFQKINPDIPVLLVSATFTPTLTKFVDDTFKNRDLIKKQLEVENLTVKSIKQTYIDMEEHKKVDTLIGIFDKLKPECQTIIFVNTTKFADQLKEQFMKRDLETFVLYKDLGPEKRDHAIRDFLDGKIKILITTNLLSRGIDNSSVSLVINVDLPTTRTQSGAIVVDFNSYLHRIGRTGRFALEGVALNVVTSEKEKGYLKEIEQHFGIQMTNIERLKQLDGFMKEVEVANAENRKQLDLLLKSK